MSAVSSPTPATYFDLSSDALQYAQTLLLSLNAQPLQTDRHDPAEPDKRWHDSGLAGLTDGPDQFVPNYPAPIARYADMGRVRARAVAMVLMKSVIPVIDRA